MSNGLPTNKNRAAWAAVALDAFVEECGSSGDDATDAADLICDLMHMFRGRVKPIDVVERGIGMWSAEQRHRAGNPDANDFATVSITAHEREA